MDDMSKKYQVECDLKSMVEAAAIAADPKRMKAVTELASKQKKAIGTVADLVERREQLARGEEMDDDEDEEPAANTKGPGDDGEKMVSSDGPVKKE